MIRVSILYPRAKDGDHFDQKYFVGTHMPMVREKMGPHGLVKAESDQCHSGKSASRSPFEAAAYLYFDSIDACNEALKNASPSLMSDIPNYTNLSPQVQISETTS